LFDEFVPPFVKQYADLGSAIVKATGEYIADVREGRFPAQLSTKVSTAATRNES
jgi:3-methyl-2-oxobutanoate hydroxymethyltransferase